MIKQNFYIGHYVSGNEVKIHSDIKQERGDITVHLTTYLTV